MGLLGVTSGGRAFSMVGRGFSTGLGFSTSFGLSAGFGFSFTTWAGDTTSGVVTSERSAAGAP
ncbi:MAG: hypothetical protein AAB304_09575, partial [Pseudomonadota bacterium]